MRGEEEGLVSLRESGATITVLRKWRAHHLRHRPLPANAYLQWLADERAAEADHGDGDSGSSGGGGLLVERVFDAALADCPGSLPLWYAYLDGMAARGDPKTLFSAGERALIALANNATPHACADAWRRLLDIANRALEDARDALSSEVGRSGSGHDDSDTDSASDSSTSDDDDDDECTAHLGSTAQRRVVSACAAQLRDLYKRRLALALPGTDDALAAYLAFEVGESECAKSLAPSSVSQSALDEVTRRVAASLAAWKVLEPWETRVNAALAASKTSSKNSAIEVTNPLGSAASPSSAPPEAVISAWSAYLAALDAAAEGGSGAAAACVSGGDRSSGGGKPAKNSKQQSGPELSSPAAIAAGFDPTLRQRLLCRAVFDCASAEFYSPVPSNASGSSSSSSIGVSDANGGAPASDALRSLLATAINELVLHGGGLPASSLLTARRLARAFPSESCVWVPLLTALERAHWSLASWLRRFDEAATRAPLDEFEERVAALADPVAMLLACIDDRGGIVADSALDYESSAPASSSSATAADAHIRTASSSSVAASAAKSSAPEALLQATLRRLLSSADAAAADSCSRRLSPVDDHLNIVKTLAVIARRVVSHAATAAAAAAKQGPLPQSVDAVNDDDGGNDAPIGCAMPPPPQPSLPAIGGIDALAASASSSSSSSLSSSSSACASTTADLRSASSARNLGVYDSTIAASVSTSGDSSAEQNWHSVLDRGRRTWTTARRALYSLHPQWEDALWTLDAFIARAHWEAAADATAADRAWDAALAYRGSNDPALAAGAGGEGKPSAARRKQGGAHTLPTPASIVSGHLEAISDARGRRAYDRCRTLYSSLVNRLLSAKQPPPTSTSFSAPDGSGGAVPSLDYVEYACTSWEEFEGAVGSYEASSASRAKWEAKRAELAKRRATTAAQRAATQAGQQAQSWRGRNDGGAPELQQQQRQGNKLMPTAATVEKQQGPQQHQKREREPPEYSESLSSTATGGPADAHCRSLHVSDAVDGTLRPIKRGRHMLYRENSPPPSTITHGDEEEGSASASAAVAPSSTSDGQRQLQKRSRLGGIGFGDSSQVEVGRGGGAAVSPPTDYEGVNFNYEGGTSPPRASPSHGTGATYTPHSPPFPTQVEVTPHSPTQVEVEEEVVMRTEEEAEEVGKAAAEDTGGVGMNRGLAALLGRFNTSSSSSGSGIGSLGPPAANATSTARTAAAVSSSAASNYDVEGGSSSINTAGRDQRGRGRGRQGPQSRSEQGPQSRTEQSFQSQGRGRGNRATGGVSNDYSGGSSSGSSARPGGAAGSGPAAPAATAVRHINNVGTAAAVAAAPLSSTSTLLASQQRRRKIALPGDEEVEGTATSAARAPSSSASSSSHYAAAAPSAAPAAIASASSLYSAPAALTAPVAVVSSAAVAASGAAADFCAEIQHISPASIAVPPPAPHAVHIDGPSIGVSVMDFEQQPRAHDATAVVAGAAPAAASTTDATINNSMNISAPPTLAVGSAATAAVTAVASSSSSSSSSGAKGAAGPSKPGGPNFSYLEQLSGSDTDPLGIFIKNLPRGCVLPATEIVALFQRYGCPVRAAHVVTDADGNSMGFGRLQFDSPAVTQAALRVRTSLRGRPVIIFPLVKRSQSAAHAAAPASGAAAPSDSGSGASSASSSVGGAPAAAAAAAAVDAAPPAPPSVTAFRPRVVRKK